MAQKRKSDEPEEQKDVETYTCHILLDEEQILECVKQVLCSRGYIVTDSIEIELDEDRDFWVRAFCKLPKTVVPPPPEPKSILTNDGQSTEIPPAS